MKICLMLLLLLKLCLGKRHNITLRNDARKNFPLSTFGFFKGGKLLVKIMNFAYQTVTPIPDGLTPKFGFSLQRTTTDGVSSYMEKATKKCLLDGGEAVRQKDDNLILLVFALNDNAISIERYGSDNFKQLHIQDEFKGQGKWNKEDLLKSHASYALNLISIGTCSKPPNQTQTSAIKFSNKSNNYSGHFTVDIDCSPQAGLYNLYFHNCLNYGNPDAVSVDFSLEMIEHNENTFLSAGEIPLPIMYSFMSAGFFITACVWVLYLRKHWMWTYKIHWLMAVLIFIKSISVAFHSLNFYYTGLEGFRVQSWAILYYVIHLLKGGILFTTIVLIGTGYFFIKHVLSSREKKLFLLVIPLQVIANVALIISESTEEGNASYKKWYEITLLVDLLCCGAILLPVVWSIRHLSEAAKTDGKAAVSLTKLKLFRQFYVMIVCYIYFTRIVVYLIKITVPFQFMWLDEFFTESATFLFFVLTGYKFRPVNNNPYLHIPQDESDDEIEMDSISKHSGYGENLTRVNKTDGRTV